MISGEQVKAARMLLNWDVSTVARTASVHEATALVIEAGNDAPVQAQILIQEALEAAGVEFPDREMVRLKTSP